MKLYEIPRESTILIESTDGSSKLTFHRLDGMYSYCTTEFGNVVHLSAVADLVSLGQGTYALKEDD